MPASEVENGPTFSSVADACQAGVAAEIAKFDLYERLFFDDRSK